MVSRKAMSLICWSPVMAFFGFEGEAFVAAVPSVAATAPPLGRFLDPFQSPSTHSWPCHQPCFPCQSSHVHASPFFQDEEEALSFQVPSWSSFSQLPFRPSAADTFTGEGADAEEAAALLPPRPGEAVAATTAAPLGASSAAAGKLDSCFSKFASRATSRSAPPRFPAGLTITAHIDRLAPKRSRSSKEETRKRLSSSAMSCRARSGSIQFCSSRHHRP
mmetsp:Transcript_93457/g.208768  ORF Transcript_93457/g.208768 Transcript_93457/m.208768 type:complete len:219 (-) Transcript_93457:590-1246(-)